MTISTRSRKDFGDSAERVAAMHLEQHESKIIARNVRTRSGEIDIIIRDAEGLAFVEVKARRGTAFGTAEEAITPRKQIRLVALAESFLALHPEFAGLAWRIDLVAIQLDRVGRVLRINHIKNAVQL
jgi:putative endonuclease